MKGKKERSCYRCVCVATFTYSATEIYNSAIYLRHTELLSDVLYKETTNPASHYRRLPLGRGPPGIIISSGPRTLHLCWRDMTAAPPKAHYWKEAYL